MRRYGSPEIQAIAGKKLEQLVMSMVPGVMILYMLISSGFLDVLYHNLPGVLVMTGCLGVSLQFPEWEERL